MWLICGLYVTYMLYMLHIYAVTHNYDTYMPHLMSAYMWHIYVAHNYASYMLDVCLQSTGNYDNITGTSNANGHCISC